PPRLRPDGRGAGQPGAPGGRRVDPARRRGPAPSRSLPPAAAVPAELLRPSRTAVRAPIRPASGSTRCDANRTADREFADTRPDHSAGPADCADYGGTADGRQEALPELRYDGQRGQHVLLLLREPVPLSRKTIWTCRVMD